MKQLTGSELQSWLYFVGECLIFNIFFFLSTFSLYNLYSSKVWDETEY